MHAGASHKHGASRATKVGSEMKSPPFISNNTAALGHPVFTGFHLKEE